MREPLVIQPNDTIELRKAHPCGNSHFRVVHAGTDIRMCCLGCGRYMTFERLKAEKMIRKVTVNELNDETKNQ